MTRVFGALRNLLLELPYLTFMAVCIIAPGQALSYTPTHDLVVMTKTNTNSDCGNGSCVPECSLIGTLTVNNSGPKTSVPIEIQIWYRTDHVEAEEAAISLVFEEQSKGNKQRAQGQAPGYACDDVEVKRIVVQCPEEDGQNCPGFYVIQIPDIPALKVQAQKIPGK